MANKAGDAFREAEARIAAWKDGEELDLKIAGLERIPDTIANLTSLQSLTCSDTQVTDLAPLKGLTRLQSLTCSGTQVTDLAPSRASQS